MKVALLLISDGRENYLERTLASAAEFLPPMDYFVWVDDSPHELGFAGAIQAGWDVILEHTDAEFVFHLEQDFTFRYPVPIDRMACELTAHPELVQIALLRQPWNDAEREAGSIIRTHPEAYEQCDGFIRHRKFFTTNPSLYPRRICERGWPQRDYSEGHFGISLFSEEPNRYAAFLGQGEEWCFHIGDERAGSGY